MDFAANRPGISAAQRSGHRRPRGAWHRGRRLMNRRKGGVIAEPSPWLVGEIKRHQSRQRPGMRRRDAAGMD